MGFSMTLSHVTEQDVAEGKNPVRTEIARTLKDIRRVLRPISDSYGIPCRNGLVRCYAKEGLALRGIRWEPS